MEGGHDRLGLVLGIESLGVALSPRAISHLRMKERAGKRSIGTMRDRQGAGAQVISVLRGTTQGLRMKERAGKRSTGMMWYRQDVGAQEMFPLDVVVQVISVSTTESRITRRMPSQRADVLNDRELGDIGSTPENHTRHDTS